MLLEVKDLAFSYRRNEYLLNKVNFEIKPGEVCGLLGKNGSGKSTLLYLLSGLMLPQIGSVSYNSQLTKHREPSMLSNMYLLPEEFDLPDVSSDDYVKYNAPFYPSFSYEDFGNYINIFELQPVKKLAQYSMGQKKKFIIAFALATQVELLFMDEPTNGLDIPSKSQFRKAIAMGMGENRSILISTHQVRDLENMIDRVLVLHDNTMLLNESIDNITAKLEFVRAFSKEELAGCIYSYFTPNGFMGLRPNLDGKETMVDLEMLFNALVAHPDAIKHLFVEL